MFENYENDQNNDISTNLKGVFTLVESVETHLSR